MHWNDETPTQNKTALVVEAYEDILGILSEELRMCGIRVTEASNGEEGYIQYCQQQFDIVIVDISLSGMSGIEFVNLIRNHYSCQPILAMSGSREDYLDTLRERYPEHLMTFIMPFHLKEFRKSVIELIDGDQAPLK